MLGAARRLMEQGSVLKTMVFTNCTGWDAAVEGSNGEGIFISSQDVYRLWKAAKGDLERETCKAELSAILHQYLHALETKILQSCTVWEEDIREWGKRWEPHFQRLPLGTDRFKCCNIQNLILPALKSSQVSLVWHGKGSSLLIFFRNNRKFPRGCSSRGSMFQHLTQEARLVLLLFSQNCWPRVYKSLGRCLLLENCLSTASMLCRACLQTSVVTVLDPLGCIPFLAVITRYHGRAKTRKQTHSSAYLECSPTSGEHLFVVYSP